MMCNAAGLLQICVCFSWNCMHRMELVDFIFLIPN